MNLLVWRQFEVKVQLNIQTCMKRCNHLRHLNARSQCTHLSLQTVHQGGDICWCSAAIFGKFSFKHLCIHVWHILLCAMCGDPSNEEAASAEALNSLWLLFTTTLSRCSLVFSPANLFIIFQFQLKTDLAPSVAPSPGLCCAFAD